jgi:gas vesicle protein
MKDSGLGSFLAGVVIGGLVGAAMGLLVAPQSGQQTRGQIGELIDEKRSAFDEAVSEGRAAAEKARSEMMTAQGEAGAEGSA